LKIGCGFVGIRCYNHAAATTSRYVCRAEASARVASEVPCPTVHHQTKSIAAFYHAIGRATARWQHVEAGLFVLAHAIMQTDYKYSSVVFLHIQSAASKVKLVDRLCHAHFDKTIIKNEWTPLLKDLNSAVAVRNSIAHWEANFILDVSVLEPWESPIALTPHHLDVRAQADTRGATTNTLNQTAEGFLALANRLLRFVAPHFSDKALRATNLPRRLLLYLENNRNDVPIPTQPP
jgi:hypothetical protein